MTIDSTTRLLCRLGAVDGEVPARLRERLARAAAGERLLDVAYRTVDTPVGQLLLAATEQGLVRVAYGVEGHDRVLERLAEQISPRILYAPERLDDAARQLEEYFCHRRRTFSLTLDWQLTHGFRREVLARLTAITYGSTQSYGAVAAAIRRERAVRAVGSACATNPLPIIVPCHRVLRSDGSLGGYIGGLPAKAALLRLESASVA